MARKKKYDYFAAFAQQMDYAMQEVDLLIEVVENFESSDKVADYLPKAHEIERAADEINHATFTALTNDFITPIDREDIINLITLLDNVVDDVEDVIHMFYMLDIQCLHSDVLKNVKLIRNSCEALKVAIHEFANRKTKKKFHNAISKVNDYEEEADVLYERQMRDLYVKSTNPLCIIVWTRIFDRVEDVCDDCEHVGDLLSNISIKN